MALQDNLVAYWSLNETSGTSVPDAHSSFTGTAVNSPTWISGKLDNALQLASASNQHVTFASVPSNSATGTVAAWVRSTTDSAQNILSFTGGSSSYFRPTIGDGATGDLTNELISIIVNPSGGFHATNSKRIGYTTATRTELFDGNWHHIAFVADGTSYKIYLDGASKTVTVGRGADSGEFTTFLPTLTAMFMAVSESSNWFVDGDLDEVALWSRGLSATEIGQLYNGGNGRGYPLFLPWYYQPDATRIVS